MKNKTALKPDDFVHLHNHTQYSLLDGLTKIPQLIEYIKQKGMPAVAITDHGTLSGVVEFYKTAKAEGIKPIIGIETYVAPRRHTDKDPVKDKIPFHLVLLAMNARGYQNLMRLSTIANLDGFYYRPRIDRDLLEKYNEGLIVLSGCIGGEVGDALRQNQYGRAKEIAAWHKKVFKDRYYLEVQDHGHADHPSKWDEQIAVTEQTLRLSGELGIPAVLTCDAHYLKHEDQEAHEVLLCVQTGSYLDDTTRMSLKEFELHVTDPMEIIERWGKKHPSLITNSRLIADRCNVGLDLGKILIPKFPVPKGETERSYLEKLVYRGLVWRYGGVAIDKAQKMDKASSQKKLPANIRERAVYELGVIERMGFSGYFLIIADFINWGKENGIVFGPGRGSAAGSIIAYGLNITTLDPLEYDLLFERFLNPDRISMPDIDIDIQDTRRDEVIRYCIDKYGSDRVANIVTFGKMAARNAIRDVARVLQVPYADADRMAKMIPPPVQGRHILLSQSLVSNPDLKAEYKTNQTSKRVFDLAVQLEGTIRSHGVHAAGVVIAPDEIVKFTPLEMAQKGVIATQYSMGPIEDLGLLKIDFLGLSNLTIIKNTLRIIKKVYKQDIDINEVPLDDQKTFELLQRGDTTGVFQLESSGMKRYLKELKPTIFDDIIAMGALYRPGPMQWIDDFIARKHQRSEIAYIHPAMEAALKPTYGIIVYQEQVMQISKDMCGFSGGQSDTLRKAIGKKKPEELAKMKTAFIEGAVKTVKADRKAMEKFWKQLEAFAAYAFPKSHAACYAMIAYQTAYLKANYPTAFMAALMTSDFDDTDRLAIEINECKHMGIEVLPPDVNESFVEFAVTPKTNQIRFGMAAIKNVGTGAVEEILRARSVDGTFSGFEDFLAKVNTRVVNRKTLESLIKSGAFDVFHNRGLLLANIDTILAYAARLQKQKISGQTDLFGAVINEGANIDPKLVLGLPEKVVNKADQLQWERELLGIYLSQHPLEDYAEVLAKQTTALSSLSAADDGKRITIGGVIVSSKEITTKSGQKMAFVRLADKTAEIELVLFPNIYQQTSELWQRDSVVIAKGKISSRASAKDSSEDPKILIDEVKSLIQNPSHGPDESNLADKQTKASTATAFAPTTVNLPKVYIRLHDGQNNETLLLLKDAIDAFQGNTEVVLVLGPATNKQIIKLPMKMHHSDESLSRLHGVVGQENVKVQ
jgi:DNA polymerase-3 subunit alpha